jgi:hypothetical protein
MKTKLIIALALIGLVACNKEQGIYPNAIRPNWNPRGVYSIVGDTGDICFNRTLNGFDCMIFGKNITDNKKLRWDRFTMVRLDDDLSIDIFDSVYNITEVWYFIDTTYNAPIVQKANGSKIKLIRKQSL